MSSPMRMAMEILVESFVAGGDPKWLADIFDRLLWLTNDNGTAIQAVRAEWLATGDILRTQIALEMEEAFPSGDRNGLVDLLSLASSRHPSLKERCNVSTQPTVVVTQRRLRDVAFRGATSAASGQRRGCWDGPVVALRHRRGRHVGRCPGESSYR